MRILLDQGIFDMRNAGQNALLQGAVERIKKLWPDASIGITTFAPHLMKLYFPEAHPVSPDGLHAWSENSGRFERMHRLIPAIVWQGVLEIREELWHRWRTLNLGSIGALLKSRLPAGETKPGTNHESNDMEDESVIDRINYSNTVTGYDLFVATGSQYITDHARDSGLGVMNCLEAAIQLGIPTAMVGQGIGPLNDFEMRAKAKSILPKVDLIFVRERLEGPNLLKTLGVDPTRVYITGDDAIELVYRARSSSWGSGIGVSVRVMPSTKVIVEETQILGSVLKQAALKYRSQLIGLPISRSIHERDDLFIRGLISGYEKSWISHSKFPTPKDLIKDTQRCRLVVTTTFHAAVFALAQGIPCICLAKSELYGNKFYGLADMFNPGCVVISMKEKTWQKQLSSAIDATWQSAEEVRPKLLEAALHQIELGNTAYQQLYKMFELKDKSLENLVEHSYEG